MRGKTDSTEMKTTTWFITHAPTLIFSLQVLVFFDWHERDKHKLMNDGQANWWRIILNKKIMGVNFFFNWARGYHVAEQGELRDFSLSKLSFPLFSIHFFLFQISVMYTVLNFFW